MLDIIRSKISLKSLYRLIFLFLFLLLIIDRLITLFYFGFVYSDIDQLIMWNGATDYSNGIFHEPFFYGQPFNYMLESFLSVPLLLMKVPIYMALPITTSIVSLMPFVILSLFFYKKQKFFWAYLCLVLPVLLPLEYNFLTTMSRGFVQAHFFIPFLFIPLFYPESKKSVTLLYLASALCFIANPSSILIIFPVFIYVLTFHIKSISFYLKSFCMLPIFILDFLFKDFYKNHPERVLHDISGLEFDSQIFFESLSSSQLFENLYPFVSSGSSLYLLVFIVLTLLAYRKGMKKESLFIVSIIFIVLISLNIPKVQEPYTVENAGIFFSVSRFYLTIPLLVIISLYMIFKDFVLRTYSFILLVGISTTSFFIKNTSIQTVVEETIENTSFPIAKNQDLLTRANYLKTLILAHDIDLLVHQMSPSWEWNNLYDSYALYPIVLYDMNQHKNTISVNIKGDRRTWLYKDAEFCERILLVGISLDKEFLKKIEYEIVSDDKILIINNKLKTKELFESLNIDFGI